MFQDLNSNNDDDFLDDFRQKIANQSMDDLEEKRSDLKRSKNVFIGAVSGMALALVVGWIVLSPRYDNDLDVDIPVIRRPQTAVKVQPADPGGMEILNQDKSVYDIVEKKHQEDKVVENLLPPPEEPKIPEIIETDVMVVEAPAAPVSPPPSNEQKKEEVAKELNQITNNEPIKVPAKPAADIKEIIKVQEGIKNKPVKYSDQVLTKNQMSETREIAKIDSTAPSEFDAEPAPVAAVVAEEAVAAGNIPVGSWQLQLMASQNKPAVEKSFAQLVKKYSILADQPHEVEEADLGAKGMFYRLKAGAFRDKEDADRLCRDLKALGGTCIVKKK